MLIHLFSAIVLAMAICTLAGSLRERWPISRMGPSDLPAGPGAGGGDWSLDPGPPFVSQFHQLILQLPAAAAGLKQLAIMTINNISGRVYGSEGARNWSAQLLSNGTALQTARRWRQALAADFSSCWGSPATWQRAGAAAVRDRRHLDGGRAAPGLPGGGHPTDAIVLQATGARHLAAVR